MNTYEFENKGYFKLAELIKKVEGSKNSLVQAVCRAAKRDGIELYQAGRSWFVEISAENLAWLDGFLFEKYGVKNVVGEISVDFGAELEGSVLHRSETPLPDTEIVEKIVEIEKIVTKYVEVEKLVEVPVMVETEIVEYVEIDKIVEVIVEVEKQEEGKGKGIFEIKTFSNEWAWVSSYAKWARLVFGVVLSLMLVRYIEAWVLKFVELNWLLSFTFAVGLSAGWEFGVKEPILKKAVVYYFKRKIAIKVLDDGDMMIKYFGRMSFLLLLCGFLFVVVDVVGTFKGADKWLEIGDYESKEMEGAKVDSFVRNADILLYSDSIIVLSKKLEGLKNDWSPAAKILVPVYNNQIELLRVELLALKSADSLALVTFNSTRKLAAGTAVASFKIDGWVLAAGSVVLQLLLVLAIYFEGWYWAGVYFFGLKK